MRISAIAKAILVRCLVIALALAFMSSRRAAQR
jgi:hypothetical protein